MKSISIHSHKGGVGKTTIAVNLAVYLAKRGHSVYLVDNDFSGPALFTFFDMYLDGSHKYINAYFENKATINEIILDMSENLGLEGKLLISLADPRPASIDKMLRLDEKDASRMLAGLSKLRIETKKPPYGVEFMIIDSAPGIGLTTINSFVNSQIILFVIKLSNADILGSINMIAGLVDELDRKITMVGNMIPADRIKSENIMEELEELISVKMIEVFGSNPIEFLGWLPTDTELQTLEFDDAMHTLRGSTSQRTIFTLNQPNHLFSRGISDMSKKLFSGEVREK